MTYQTRGGQVALICAAFFMGNFLSNGAEAMTKKPDVNTAATTYSCTAAGHPEAQALLCDTLAQHLAEQGVDAQAGQGAGLQIDVTLEQVTDVIIAGQMTWRDGTGASGQTPRLEASGQDGAPQAAVYRNFVQSLFIVAKPPLVKK